MFNRNKKNWNTFICPNCGGEVREGARACPYCGSDDRTGWSDKTYMDNVDLPADEEEYQEIYSREFGGGKPGSGVHGRWITAVGAVLLAGFAVMILIRACG